MRFRSWGLIGAGSVLLLGGLALLGGSPAAAQGSLSQQVLQLLSRVNSWIGTNTFYDLRVPCTSIPSDTAARLYADGGCTLYYNGSSISGGGGPTTPHNLLSSTHPDTVPADPSAGAIIVGNTDFPSLWVEVPASIGFVQSDGFGDTFFSTDGSTLTAIPASQLVGALPAIDGSSLTDLSATALTSGTVPVARLAGITTTQISGTAGITHGQLALTGSIVNADVSSSAALAYSKLALTNSLVAGDLTSGAVTMAKIAQAGASSGQVIAWSGTAWAPASVSGAGTVTSVGLTTPAIFTVTGSPVTGSGTLAIAAASQTQNQFWAAPDGSNGTPIFRAFVNADLPLSGVAAGTYPSVTVNTRGIVTAAGTTIDLTTVPGASILPRANGGTGTAVSVDDTVLVGNGTSWVGTPLPNCSRVVQYDTSTNSWSCTATIAHGSLSASAPLTDTATWTNNLVTYNQFAMAITDTASVATSTLANWTVNAASVFAVRKDGSLQLGGSRTYGAGTPTITAGFGTSPSVAGFDSAFRVTQGTPVGTTGTVTFSTAFTHAPICTAMDETTPAGNPISLATTTTTVAVVAAGTMVAGDAIGITCLGY